MSTLWLMLGLISLVIGVLVWGVLFTEKQESLAKKR